LDQEKNERADKLPEELRRRDTSENEEKEALRNLNRKKSLKRTMAQSEEEIAETL